MADVCASCVGGVWLTCAVLCVQVRVCELLMDAGGDLEGKNKRGATPVDMAISGGSRPTVELLLDHARLRRHDQVLAAAEAAAEWRRRLEAGERTVSELRGVVAPLVEPAVSVQRVGGWRRGGRPDLHIDFCDITQVEATDGLALKEAAAEHERLGRPLLIRNAAGRAAADGDPYAPGGALETVWSRPSMLRRFGSDSFKVFRQRNGTKQSLSMTMAAYLASMERAKASDSDAPDWLVEYGLAPSNPLVDSHHAVVGQILPDLFRDDDGARSLGVNNYQFMVAPAGTGASPHFHFTSARLMVYGRARWFLWPPAQAFYSSKPVLQWYRDDYPTMDGPGRPMECVQGPGDLFFVPPHWGHAVLYLEDTAGMATLFRA